MWLDYLTVFLLAAVILLQIIAFTRKNSADTATAEVRSSGERIERTVRDEFARNREESGGAARQLREEMAKQDAAAREEMTRAIGGFGDSMQSRIVQLGQTQQERMDAFGNQLKALIETNESKLGTVRETLELSLTSLKQSAAQQDVEGRKELAAGMTKLGETLAARITEMAGFQKQQLEVFAQGLNTLSTNTGQKLEAVRETVEKKLGELQHDNAQKIEQMRQTVDEKLHNTLEQRLGESFKLVSQQLEQVHSGLGEMRVLATGVGDLKKVLTNIKTRGGWGEVQLGNLLEQMLTPDQFDRNVAPKEGSNERVEYAVRLPGKDADGAAVWLPIDAKFPQEEFQRLVDAHERGDVEAAEAASNALQASVRLEAKKINEKYVNPPRTTDFAIMFLPTEGLFAEVLRRPGLCETLQREFRVVLCGPTNLAALLSSLQMGFRTLAIERRSSEVWTVLGAIKTEFGKFGIAIDRVKKKLLEATNTVEDAQTRTRVMTRRLEAAQELPAAEAASVLGADPFDLLADEPEDSEATKP